MTRNRRSEAAEIGHGPPHSRGREARRLGVLITGLGWVRLPDSLADIEHWRQHAAGPGAGDDVRAVMAGIADILADAMVTGRGVVSYADLPHKIILHWPDSGDHVLDARAFAASLGTTEHDVRQSLADLCRAGVLSRCADDDSDDSCPDGGYRSQVGLADLLAAFRGGVS